jgi:hypothetical protein
MTDRADPAAPAERLAAHFLAAAEMPSSSTAPAASGTTWR